MDDEAAGHDRPLRVELDLHLDRQPICGRLRTGCGTAERFVGWLGFVDALKRVHDTPPQRKATTDQEDTEMIDRATELKRTLVLGGTGKTGRRVVERLRARGLPVRVGSRSGTPPFDWDDRSTWAPALDGVGSVYLTYYPDLAVPGAVEATRSFAKLA